MSSSSLHLAGAVHVSTATGEAPAVVRVAAVTKTVSAPPASPTDQAAAARDDEIESLTQIPDRDAAKIAAARAYVLQAATLPTELAAMAKAIDAAMPGREREEALALAALGRGRSDALANAAAVAWVKGGQAQALFLAAAAAKAQPEDVNALNTFGALLSHAGYEQKGIPLLRFLAERLPQDPTVLSNLGVAWLNLGEIDEAKKYLGRCLAVAPGHGAANLAAGVIAESEKRVAAATEHYRRAAASNSSPLARRVLRSRHTAHRAPKGFMGMVPKKDYFSATGFAPRAPQKLLADYDLKFAEKKAYEASLQALIQKETLKVQEATITMMGEAMRGGGAAPKNPYAKLDWTNHLRALNAEGRMGTAVKRLAERQQAIVALRLQAEADARRVPHDPASNIPPCVGQRPVYQAALAKMGEQYEQMVGETLFIWRDVTNEQLTYLRFTSPTATMYRASFPGQVVAYLSYVSKLNTELPLVADPCAKQNLERGPTFELVSPSPGDCPFSFTIKAIIAELNMTCTSIGFDFEAGLAFSANKDFVSGETTLTAGVGAKMDLLEIGKASVTGQVVVAWDAQNELSYVGVEAIAAAKLSGIPGLSGELAEDTFDLGREAGAPPAGPSLEVSGDALVRDLVKVGSDTKLGVTIGPKGVESSLSGSVSGAVLGDKIFEAKLP